MYGKKDRNDIEKKEVKSSIIFLACQWSVTDFCFFFIQLPHGDKPAEMNIICCEREREKLEFNELLNHFETPKIPRIVNEIPRNFSTHLH